jgi:hypothetical protein
VREQPIITSNKKAPRQSPKGFFFAQHSQEIGFLEKEIRFLFDLGFLEKYCDIIRARDGVQTLVWTRFTFWRRLICEDKV